jgi:N-acetylglucosaminyldiphosphoundecaprenol N-acetyl-beta-D-mannosaminyltransferase
LTEAFKISEIGRSFHFVNAYSLVSASKNPIHCKSINSGYSFCDSKPLSWYSKFTKSEVKQIRGSDFFALGLRSQYSRRHLIIGGGKINSENFCKKVLGLTGKDVDIRFYNPPHTSNIDELHRLCRIAIVESDPDVIWLAIGTPKQDILASGLASEIPKNFFCIGAAVNFVSGSVRESPKLLSNLGLEWFFRFIQEPRRLWRRYLIGNAQFLILVLEDVRWRIKMKLSDRLHRNV